MQRTPGPSHRGFRGNRGMVSFAVLIFSIVAVLILVANFRLNYAVSVSGDAFDTFNSQTVEKNGVAQLVKESILALGETATENSTNTIQTEIQNRLSHLNFPPGVSVALETAPNVPANPFFPFVPSTASLPVAQPAYFPGPSDTGRGIAGMGGLFNSLLIQGPVSDLGRFTYTFARSSSNAPGEDCTYSVNADLFSVPLTNVDVIAYGLPVSGSIPAQAPTVPQGMFGSGVSALVVTSNDPVNDPTAYPDLFAPSTPEQLPYQFRNGASVSWNAYEYLWYPYDQNGRYSYFHELRIAAQAEADPGNQASSPSDPTPPVGAVYDFSLPPFDSSNPGYYPCNPTIAGVSVSGNSLTIDCSAVQSQTIAVVDSQGIGSVTILGSATTGSPFVLLIRNTAGNLQNGPGPRTTVTFSGNNLRSAIFYLENSAVGFSGNPQIAGALFLDPTTVASGSVTWFGHLSLYAAASPLPPAGTLNIAINDSPGVKSDLAAIAPRVLLVSTTATRQ